MIMTENDKVEVVLVNTVHNCSSDFASKLRKKTYTVMFIAC